MSEEMIKDVVNESVATPEVAPVEAAPVEPVVAPTPTVNTFGADQAVIDKLNEFGADQSVIEKIVSGLGVTSIDELKLLKEDDLVGAGMKLIKARKLASDISEASKPAPSVAINTAGVIGNQFDVLLPVVSDDSSWLESMRTGGVKKVNNASLESAVRAALAKRVGLFDLPEKITTAMETYADEIEEQVGEDYFKMKRLLTRRSYGDLFSLIDGFNGSDINEKRKRVFLDRIDGLWPALEDSYRVLCNWYECYRDSFSDPSLLMAAFAGAPAAGMMTAVPDTSSLQSVGETVIDAINKAFRGFGLLTSSALAYEAQEIRKAIDNPNLPAMIGAANREQMFKKLGINVSSEYIRLEKNLIRYTLAFCKCSEVTADAEARFYVALYQLGSQIDWAKLTGAKMATLTGKKFQRETL